MNGWVASLNSTSQGAITSLGADWIVPPTPSSAQNQTLFFFPGVEPAATGDVDLATGAGLERVRRPRLDDRQLGLP